MTMMKTLTTRKTRDISFTRHLVQGGKIVLSNLMVLVVRLSWFCPATVCGAWYSASFSRYLNNM